MYTDGRHLRFTVVIVLAVINSIVTSAYLIMTDRGIMEAAYQTEAVSEAILPLAVAGVIPVIIGSYGLYMRRMWGLGFFTLGSGGFLFASLAGVILSLESSIFGILFYLSLYLILFNIIASIYIWIFRFNLKDF